MCQYRIARVVVALRSNDLLEYFPPLGGWRIRASVTLPLSAIGQLLEASDKGNIRAMLYYHGMRARGDSNLKPSDPYY